MWIFLLPYQWHILKILIKYSNSTIFQHFYIIQAINNYCKSAFWKTTNLQPQKKCQRSPILKERQHVCEKKAKVFRNFSSISTSFVPLLFTKILLIEFYFVLPKNTNYVSLKRIKTFRKYISLKFWLCCLNILHIF